MEKITLDNGIHDIPNDIYHQSNGISRSALMEFKRSPYHYQKKYLLEHEPKEPTPAMVMGNLIHTLTLEPALFDDEYIIMPKFDRRTTVGKAGYNAFQANLSGRICVSEDDYTKAQAIALAVREHELGGALLVDGIHVEQSIYFTHKATGIQCKARPDAMLGSVVVDLKTTADASFRAFQSSAYKFGYFLQAGMIHEALKSIDIQMDKFIFLAVEKELPYPLGIYTLDDEALDYGVNQFNELMNNMAFCLENNKWPGYPVMNLTVPGYAKYDTNEMETEE